LRYLQKLFTQRGSTCSEFIYSFRLDQAARLLHRRAELAANQHLSEIAYACGFRGYAHFARKFRHRFGHAPGARPAGYIRARHQSECACAIGSRRHLQSKLRAGLAFAAKLSTSALHKDRGPRHS